MDERFETQLPPTSFAPSDARAFFRTALETWSLDGFGAMTELLATELVTNAIRHVGSPISLSVETHDDRIRVGVTDESADVPLLLTVDANTDHGRGIFIVNALADSWGYEHDDHGGKTVWFEIDVSTATDEVHGD